MKSLSKRDISIIAIVLFIGIVIGWSAASIYYGGKESVTVENPVNEALKKRVDSLEANIVIRDSLERMEDKKQAMSDSILINNNKSLKKDYEKYKDLDVDARIKYFNDVLSSKSVWR